MAHFVESTPSMANIRVTQESERSLRRLLAKAHFYTAGNRWHFASSVVVIGLALVSPVVLVYKPGLGAYLGAIAGAWIFGSRLLFEPVRQGYQTKGALTQELFDCEVLGLAWNNAFVQPPNDEKILKASKRFSNEKTVAKEREWYPAQVEMAWPRSVITCQRANAVWARHQQRAYGVMLLIVAGTWAVFGMFISLSQNATLAAYLTTIGLPTLPALLDSIDLAKKHFAASSQRQSLEENCDRLFDQNTATHATLREIQDRIFELRQDDPPVAGWFYSIIAKSYEAAMRYAAKERADEERGVENAAHS